MPFSRLPLLVGLSLALFLPASSAMAQAAARCFAPGGPGTVQTALVLSGGGARGLAHIGVLRVLDSLGVRPSLVAGTSIGALVGALYADGLGGRQLDSLVRDVEFERFFRRYAPIAFLTAGDLRSPVAREPQLNALLDHLLLHANLRAAGNFGRLPIPFVAVATEMQSRAPVVLDGGDLAEAVRASIAIPLVFSPVPIAGRALLDGGLSANLPVDIARTRGAARVLASDVGPSIEEPVGGTSTAAMLNYLVDQLFLQPLPSFGPQDLRVRPDVHHFNPLGFSRRVVGALIDSGYVAATRALQGCVPAVAPARIADGAALRPAPSHLASLQRQLTLVADEGAFESVWLRPSGAGDSIAFAPVAVPTSRQAAFLGGSYDVHEGGRVWLASTGIAPSRIAPSRIGLRGGGALVVSEYRQQLALFAGTPARNALPALAETGVGADSGHVPLPDPRTRRPPWSSRFLDFVRPEATLTLSREVVRLYDRQGARAGRPATRDLFAFAGGVATPATGWRIALGPAVHSWSVRDPSAPQAGAHAFGGMARVARLFAPPAAGPHVAISPMIAVEGLTFDRYRRATAVAELPLDARDLTLFPRADLGWGASLPLSALLQVGGRSGLPGVRDGERVGDRTAAVALSVLRRVAGPVYAGLSAGAGHSTLSASSANHVALRAQPQGGIAGGEAVIAAETPLGPLRLSYGAATNRRTTFKLRIGG